MKYEDITSIASSVIAVTLIIGTFVYLPKGGENKRKNNLLKILLNGKCKFKSHDYSQNNKKYSYVRIQR